MLSFCKQNMKIDVITTSSKCQNLISALTHVDITHRKHYFKVQIYLRTGFLWNVSNEILLNAVKCQDYSFYRFWVIEGKPTGEWEGGGGGVKSHPLPRLESIHKELRVRSYTFFYCEMTIYIPFMLFKSNHVWFEKYKLENKQSIQYLIIYRRFVNLGFNKAIYLLFYQNWFLLCKPLIYISV